jgi:hypothetical protein
MKLNDIAFILRQLRNQYKPNIEPEMLDTLVHSGLVEIMPGMEYQNKLRYSLTADVLKKELSNFEHTLVSHESARQYLAKKLASSMHQKFSWQSTLDKEKNELIAFDEKIAKIRTEIEEKRIALSHAEDSARAIEGYINVNRFAIKLLEKAEILLPRMESRLYRLGNFDLETFEAEIGSLDKAIYETLARFLNFIHLLAHTYAADEINIYTIEAALQLSRFPGEIENLFRRFKEISRLLKNRGWDSNRQMPIAAGLVGMFEYEPEEAVRRIIEVQEGLKTIDYPDNYTVANASLIIVKNKADSNLGATLQNIESVFKRMKKLSDWSYTSTNAPIAARLFFRGEGAVERVHKIFLELSDSEWSNNHKTAILAVVLECSFWTVEEMVARTQKIFDCMQENGWDRLESYNIPAGILALLPGSPGELVESLEAINKWLEKNKLNRNSTYLAATLLANTYITLADGDFFQKISAFVSASAPDEKNMNDFSTFSLGWVVIADLLNNGRLYLRYGSYDDH